MNPLPHANNAGSMRPILGRLIKAMDHHELHNIHGLTVGDSVELNNILYSLDKYSKELEVFQTIHDPLVVEAVCELLDPPARFPSNDEQP